MFKRLFKTFAGLALGALLLQNAQAVVVVTGAGTWDATATTSTFSAPGATWSFSFSLPDAVTDPTTQFSALSYRLGGVAVAATATAIDFYDAIDGGMFDIDFGSAGAVSFFGAAVRNGSGLVLGRYDVFAGLDGGLSAGSGAITLAVPEPGTWLLLIGGLAGVTAVRRRRRTL